MLATSTIKVISLHLFRMSANIDNHEWLRQMYLDTLQESRFHTFKRLNTIVFVLLTLLFLNVLFTRPDKLINLIFLVLVVLSALYMLWRLTREKAALANFPSDTTHLDGETIRAGIDKIRDNQRRLRLQMALFTIPFLLYFFIDMIFNSTMEVDKYNLTFKILFFLLLIGIYYTVFFRIREVNFDRDKSKN